MSDASTKLTHNFYGIKPNDERVIDEESFARMLETARKEGVEKEYCLFFGGKIFFHSDSLEKVREHENEHDSIGFTLLSPVL